MPLRSKYSPQRRILQLSLKIRHHVSHPHRTACKMVVLYILIFSFLDSKQHEIFLDRMATSIIKIQSPIVFLLNKIFLTILTVPHLRRSCYISLRHNFALHYGNERDLYYYSNEINNKRGRISVKVKPTFGGLH
jgi:hypothetical protein